MLDEENGFCRILLNAFLLLLGAITASANSIDMDREVLLNLKQYLEDSNQVNRGQYSEWNSTTSPCEWKGIRCTTSNGTNSPRRVNGVDLRGNSISSSVFRNFSALTELSYLDLSQNTISGPIPIDLNRCTKLSYLNLSHNLITGELNLTGLTNLRVLDLSTNRFEGEVRFSVPTVCASLAVMNASSNNFTGSITNSFDHCYSLEHLDLSTNQFTGGIWAQFDRLKRFLVSENHLSGEIPASSLGENCSLQTIDLSQNNFSGFFPGEVSNCRNLLILNLWGNKFTGKIPESVGSITSLEGLFLGNNSFDRDIPESLLNLTSLKFLDLSRNKFGGEIQGIFGRFTSVKYLVLHGNSYTTGIESSGILELHNLVRLDLSFNNFSGPLPIQMSLMDNLKFLILSTNQFNGSIPTEFGNFRRLQALDLSYNELTGSIPASLGNLSSLLWLMLANNSLTGEIPPELGNCQSLLWLNLANNNLTGHFPPELVNVGRDPSLTFETNRLDSDRVVAGSGECLAMRRWIPADYPPFSFVYTLLTRKTCRSIWDRLLKGIGIFPVCSNRSSYQISGYVQLSGNSLSGPIPSGIGGMKNFSMIHLGVNIFTGEIPKEVRGLNLAVLNLSSNGFSGEIPSELGEVTCLQNLDLSYNNFSGIFPVSLNNLTNLNKFNVSYNPLISGKIPAVGQLATFEKESFLGDPLLILPYTDTGRNHSENDGKGVRGNRKESSKVADWMVFVAITVAFLLCGLFSVAVYKLMGGSLDDLEDRELLGNGKEFGSGSSSYDVVPVIRLVKRAFTYSDIVKATGNFSENKVIGRGGFGTVFRGTLPDGREIAVKKLQKEGIEGEKEFRAEMEVLCSDSVDDWPHPNLVPLYGWCLYGSEKILVYKYMEGGSLEDLVSDRIRLTWQSRLQVAADVARALVFLHHECFPAIVHRDVKASNVLLDGIGRACVTDFGLARAVEVGDSHVSTVVAGTVGYVAPEYGQTWQATTKGDVYSFGVLAMELATGRRALDGGEECLVEWARRVVAVGPLGSGQAVLPVAALASGRPEGADEMCELLRIGIRCTAESPQARPNMKEVLGMLFRISIIHNYGSPSPPPSK